MKEFNLFAIKQDYSLYFPGLPMKMTFFVGPYDLLNETRKPHAMTVEGKRSKTLVCFVYLEVANPYEILGQLRKA